MEKSQSLTKSRRDVKQSLEAQNIYYRKNLIFISFVKGLNPDTSDTQGRACEEDERSVFIDSQNRYSNSIPKMV